MDSLLKAGAWKFDKDIASAQVALAEAQVLQTRTDLDRVHAPAGAGLQGIRGLGGTVIKTNVDVKRARLIQATLVAADDQMEKRP
jgi:hypothetical protein